MIMHQVTEIYEPNLDYDYSVAQTHHKPDGIIFIEIVSCDWQDYFSNFGHFFKMIMNQVNEIYEPNLEVTSFTRVSY